MIEGHLIVIGAMKAGTTTLHELLSRHPDLVRGQRKELDYFNGRRWRGPDHYDRLFPDVPEGRAVLTLDASPAYAKAGLRALAPRRIARLRRPVHLVYLLRDPVDRALSHIRHNIGRGRIAADALPRLKTESYVLASRYSEQIEAYEAAGLGDRLLLLDFEALCHDPAAAVAEVCRHAGLAPLAVEAPVHANRSALPAESVGGLDLEALRLSIRGERRRMITRHGFEPARAWARFRDRTG